MADQDEVLMTPTEVAAMVRLPVGTLYQYRSRGQGPKGFRVGKHIRYRRSDVNTWLEALADEHGPHAA